MQDIVSKTPTTQTTDTKQTPQKDTEKQKHDSSGTLIEWSAPEYDYIHKSPDWYWAIGIITIALIVVGILTRNVLFIVLVVLSGFTIALYSARKPNIVSFTLTVRGIQIDTKLFPYDTLDSFWMHYDPPHKKELGIISKKALMPRIVINLGDTDPNAIREHLVKFLEEKHHEESLTESIARYIGF